MIEKDSIIIEKYKQIKVTAVAKYIRKYYDFQNTSYEVNNKEPKIVVLGSFSSIFYEFIEKLGFRTIHMKDINDFLRKNTAFKSFQEVVINAKQSGHVHASIMSWFKKNASPEELAYIELSAKNQSDYSYYKRRLNEDLTLAIALKDFTAASLFAEMINESQVPALEWNSSDDGAIQELYIHDAMYHMPSRIHSIIFNEAEAFGHNFSDIEKQECLDEAYSILADDDDIFSSSDSIIVREVEELLSYYKKHKEKEANQNDKQQN